jgi:16S rRNA A1518/A1519 N6-dimethyltransferase RsmA/KsgA/DIM1 with predicted DNA glycosylase/AP lyase activity
MPDVSHIKELNEVLVEAMRRRIADLGPDESGAYNFYATRAERGDMFSNYDVAITRAILESGVSYERVDEIGPGVGQLVFLLALNGFKARGIEIDVRRANAGKAMQQAVEARWPEVKGRCDIVHNAFPMASDMEPTADSLILSTNLVFTTSHDKAQKIVDSMVLYKSAVVDMDRLFEKRTTPEKQAEAFAYFKAAGHTEPKSFLDLGDSGRYYIFG